MNTQTVKFWAIQNRTDHGKRSPWVVRWSVQAGSRRVQASQSFTHRVKADQFRSQLMTAYAAGEKFSLHTKLPESWNREQVSVATWANTWVQQNWATWKPNSRRAAVHVVADSLPLLVAHTAPELTDEQMAALRSSTRDWLSSPALEMPEYLQRWSLNLRDLTHAEAKLADAELSRTSEGAPKASVTARRYRTTMRMMLAAAVEQKQCDENVWPKHSQRRTSQKINHTVQAADLPTFRQAQEAFDRMQNHQPASGGLRVLSYVVYLAGLRPSEARALHIEDLDLPAEGWGSILVRRAITDAGDSFTGAGEEEGVTKTGTSRTVPIPPVLVSILRDWAGERTSGLLVATRTGKPVTISNWGRAWRAARGDKPWRLYDLRHACATTWLAAGVPIGTVARRMGHSPDVLLRIYTGALTGDDEIANDRIEAALQA